MNRERLKTPPPMKNISLSCKYCISTLLLLFTVWVRPHAQIVNLIPDPSFEDTLGFQNVFTQTSLKHWKNLDSTKLNVCPTVYFSLISPYINYTLPENIWMNQYPKSGRGLIEFDNFFYYMPGVSKREMCRTRLKSKLIAGKTYCAKIYAVFGERYTAHVTDGLQLYFDNGGLDTMINIHGDSTGIYPHIVPQIALAQGQVLTDTINWNLLMGSFVANGTEEFLTIGNFKTDSATTKIQINTLTIGNNFSVLLVDDVSVYPIDLKDWLPPTYGYADTAIIGLPNYETPDAKWYTYNMQLIDSGSQIKVVPPISGTKYICGIDLCNTMVFDTVEVIQWPMAIGDEHAQKNNLQVYPNPSSNIITIKHIVGDKVSVYNSLGALMLTQEAKENRADIRISHLPRGLYFVQDKTRVVKWIKE